MVISVFFSILGLSLGAGLIIDFVSVRDGLIIALTMYDNTLAGISAYSPYHYAAGEHRRTAPRSVSRRKYFVRDSA